MLTFGIDVNVMRLYNGRLSFYGRINFGRARFWLSRWDKVRVSGHRTLRCPFAADMCWYAGT